MSKDIFIDLVKEDQETDQRIMNLEQSLEEARVLLFEAIDKFPVEIKADLWTTRVRAWLKNNE